ncbi:5-oxoprolinase subunit C family protein [Gemmiger sp.]
MSITVRDPGRLTTVQDAGRTGYAAQGYRTCGAADGYAYRLGNALVGNDPGAAVLECTLRGAALRFESDTVFALTGAESPAALDGTPVPYYAPLFAKAGSTLEMGAAASGLRSYLAVGGGISTPPVLGSRATDVKCGIGGLAGRKLAKGDTLPTGPCDTAALWQAITAKHLDRPLRDKAVCAGLHPVRVQGAQTLPLLRAVPGPQDAAFTAQGLYDFTHSIYTLTPNCDRMACKLAGTPLQMHRGADILSDGIVPGSVQVSADGQPIVMLADHQTTGGYAKIATVISADLPALAQLRPGQRVCFTFVTPTRAVQAARRQAALWQRVRNRL